MTTTKSVQARLERRRAEEANAFVRAHAQAPVDPDVLPGDGDLSWLGAAIGLGCVVVVFGLAWLALSGRFAW